MKKALTIILMLTPLVGALGGCAFKRVSFDNKTTTEETKLLGLQLRRISDPGRDVKASSDFHIQDAIYSEVAAHYAISHQASIDLTKVGMKLEAEKSDLQDLQLQLIDLQKQQSEIESLRHVWDADSITTYAPWKSKITTDLPTQAKTTTRSGRFKTAQELAQGYLAYKAKKTEEYRQAKLPNHAEAVAQIIDKIMESDQFKTLGQALDKLNASSANPADPNLSYAVNNASEALIAASGNIVDAILKDSTEEKKEVAAQITLLEERKNNVNANVQELQALLGRYGIFGEQEIQELFKTLDRARMTASATANAPNPAAIAAQRKLAQTEKELDQAQQDLKAIEQTNIPALAKAAAVSAQRNKIDDLQGQYDEALQEYLAVTNDTAAVTNYEGPGERSVIYSFSLLGAPDNIQRYPNGVIKSVGEQPQSKGLGHVFVDGLWRTVRVVAIPAAFVASVFALR